MGPGQRRGLSRRRGRQRIQFPPPTSDPNPDCCSFVRRSVVSQISGRRSRSRNWRSTVPCVPRLSTVRTSCSSANCSVAFISASPAQWNTTTAKRGTPCATPATKLPAWHGSHSSWRRAPQETDQRGQGECPWSFATVARNGNRSAAEFPGVTVEHQYVDAMSMHLMNQPRTTTWCSRKTSSATFSVGRIRRDHRVARHAAFGDNRRQGRLYEPVHGRRRTSPVRAWQIRWEQSDQRMILRHSGGLEAEATAIETSVRKVLEQGLPHRGPRAPTRGPKVRDEQRTSAASH